MVIRLHPKIEERDVFEFFEERKVMPINDIKIIRDPKSGKSKGVAYVEFGTPECVLKAISLSGSIF